ncbi:MAG: 6-carboxytetrahydropterin synthase [Bacteroidales bacterium]|jgi:6-pyruvoyltetrahydropterin/6-carboxytetrahydropterin synthase|nr:6-carboxytetrahydropterin synthase [Bacteroidales bacterium]
MKLRITKEFAFEASHALTDYDGLCRNIHGHSYKLFITLRGTPNEDRKSPKYGMVMDFADLKKLVQKYILDDFDHALVLQNDSPYAQLTTKIISVPYQPTCENLLLDFVSRIADRLPEGVDLVEVCLYETASSCARWLAEEQ